MKRTALKTRTPLKAKSGFKPKAVGSIKFTVSTSMKRRETPKKVGLRLVGVSTPAQAKRRIQALLRELVILRDGGCVLRVVLGSCSGPLQAEHLITRSNAATFADPRNVICLCQYHHIFWKPQHSRLYWELVEKHVGPKIWNWLKLAESDKSPHKVDLKLAELVLQQDVRKIQSSIQS